MPLALLATMPPTMQAPIEAGSGPSFRPSGASSALASAPMTPGPSRTRAPPSRTSRPRNPPETITSTESLTAWPERLVPAARKVTGRRRAEVAARTRSTSSASRTRTASFGTSR